MKKLLEFTRNVQIARQELDSYRDLLLPRTELSENGDLLPFFKKNTQLIALLGFLHEPLDIDRIGWNYDLFGDFKPDFVAGSRLQHSYCFVEFQDAAIDSIFKKVYRANPVWSGSFEEAFGQVVDWAYKLADSEKKDDFDNRFGSPTIDANFVIVIGRSHFLDSSDYKRFNWRRRHIALGTKQIKCLTYDELLQQFGTILNILPAAASADAELEDGA